MFRPFHRQPFVGRHAELFLEHAPEGVDAVAAHLRQTVGVFRLAVVRQHKALERHVLVGHGVEEQAQFLRGVVLGEEPDEFLVLQAPQGGFVLFVVQIAAHAVHDVGEACAGGQLAVNIGLARPGLHMLVGIEEREDAVLRAAHGVAEIMDEQHRVAQRHAVIVAAAGDEQHLPGAEELFFEQIARDADMPFLAEDEHVLFQPVACPLGSLLVTAETKITARWIFRADCIVLLFGGAHIVSPGCGFS